MDQETLHKFWLGAPGGRLCPWQQSRALAQRDFHKEIHGEQPKLSWNAERVTKVGGGHLEKGSLHEFLAKVDPGPEWFPGKHLGTKRGLALLLNAAKRRCIASSAMAAKEAGEEPCVAAVLGACPAAKMNPKTKRPFCARMIRMVFTEDCSKVSPDPVQLQHAHTALWMHCISCLGRCFVNFRHLWFA